MSPDALASFDVALRRAANPGPLTLTGTNSWVVGRDPAWIVDPGPDLEEHLDALAAEVRARGGVGGIAVTHSHADHSAGLRGLCRRLGPGVAVGAGAGWAVPHEVTSVEQGRILVLAEGDCFGPLRVLGLPGHSGDHLGFVLGAEAGATICFTGDAVLGEGSVFVAADMVGYLRGLERLRDLRPVLLCPGHGPVVADPSSHIAAYLAHRAEREEAVRAAWRDGLRDDALLVAVWGPLPRRLREVAAVTLQAHLHKLDAEGRLD